MFHLFYIDRTHNHKLTELAGFMASVFSEEPPVFKAPTQDISNSSSNASHNAASSISSFEPASERYSSAQTQQQTSLYNNNSNNTLNSNTNMHASNHLPSSTTSSVKPMTAEELKKMETDARILTLKQELTTKLQQTMARINKKSTGQIDELFARQSRLQQGAQQLARCTGAMDSELKAVQASTQELEQSIAHAQEWLQKHHRPEESLKVEEVLGATDTWSRDLMECVAKDNAISDTLLALDNALGDDTIDLRSFLKQVRSLGRKQFTARALAIKIQEKQKQAGFHLGAHRSSISIQNSLSALDAVADARNSSVSGRHPPSDPPTNQKNPVVSRGTRSRSSAILGVPPSLRASITSTQ